MSRSAFPAALRAASLSCAVFSLPAAAQTAPPVQIPNAEADVVVTATRTPQPIQRAGSAITVVTGEDLAKTNPLSFVDALRAVPGLDISQAGAPGGATTVRLRGGNSGHTLVLVDGVRVGDPTGIANDFDFANFIPGAIERIEVLRGPQSALYGSDAMGGVVNIITRKGKGPMQGYVDTEFGRYGTVTTTGGVFGTQGPWSYALSSGWQKSAGFSSYGYRIGRIERSYANPNGLEADGVKRWGGNARIGFDPGTGVRLEVGAMASTTFAQYDGGFGAIPDTPAESHRRFAQVYGKASVDTFGNMLTHNLQLFANQTNRTFRDLSYTSPSGRVSSDTRSEFLGNRYGAEYQGDLRLGTFGLLSFGGRLERENAETYTTNLQPVATLRKQTLDKGQSTHSLFALWQLPIGERLDVSLAGRIDDVIDVKTFNTWRATAAFRLPELSTKLRASAGTGGKAPTLFQLYSTFGNANLQPEESYGYDGGFDTDLFGGRGRVSFSAFANSYTNLIDFNATTLRYINVARAKTSGVETSASLELWPDYLKVKATYTYLQAKDELTHLTLARRAPHTGQLSLIITPTAKWTIEPVLTLVSGRFSGTNETSRLAPYARLDIRTQYQLDQTWTLHARVENVTNAHYQDIATYGTTGRAAYAGLKASW